MPEKQLQFIMPGSLKKCWLMLQQILLNIWLLTQNTQNRLSMLWYAHDLFYWLVTWPDFNDQFHMTWFQWPISNHWILVTSVTWPDFNDKCHMAWFLWPWPCFWLSLYRKVWRGSWWSLSDSCSREPDFFHFCINHIPENKYPHLVNSVSDFYTILSFSCSQIDFGHPTNKRIIRISYLWITV